MGLDQYAFKVKENGDRIEIARWRKHNRLQGWMETLYLEKGGREEFNCVDVELKLDDLVQLQEDITSRSLPPTEGFFFGSDSYVTYDDLQSDLDFIEVAKKALDCNDKIVYSSWW